MKKDIGNQVLTPIDEREIMSGKFVKVEDKNERK